MKRLNEKELMVVDGGSLFTIGSMYVGAVVGKKLCVLLQVKLLLLRLLDLLLEWHVEQHMLLVDSK
ncbi:hypothetical protein [Halonatronum saccharophilum]|uniref:hypothetical protein n=1 Tax=Halonatronum saccharophilum TaxID=150060 RepID=UPI000484EB9C|nr:hypothetical protein [Halonatronum saccharophilum]